MSYKKQELLTPREPLVSPYVFGGVRVARLCSFQGCVFALFVFVVCLVYPMLPVSMDCPFLIAPSVFSNVIQHSYVYIAINRNMHSVFMRTIAFFVSQ